MIPQGLGMVKTVFPPEELGGVFAAFGPIMGLAAMPARSSRAGSSTPTCSAPAGG